MIEKKRTSTFTFFGSKKSFKRSCFFLLSLCFSVLTYAQHPGWNSTTSSEFIMPVSNLSTHLMSAQETEKHQKIQNLDYAKSTQSVLIGHLPNLQQDGILEFTIPGFDCPIRAKAKYVSVNSAAHHSGNNGHTEPWGNGATSINNYKWSGYFEACDNSCSRLGFMRVNSNDSGLYATIYVNDRQYELYSIQGNSGLLVEVDMEEINAIEANCYSPEHNNEATGQSSGSNEPDPYETGNCTIDVLIMYTQKAADNAVEGIFQKAEDLIDFNNEAFRNSGLGADEVKLRLVGVELLESFVETGNFLFDYNNDFSNNNYVTERRDAKHADFVMLLANHQDYIFTGLVGAVESDIKDASVFGNNIEDYENPDVRGMSLINRPNEHFHFGHEIGHCFGADHQTCTTLPSTNCIASDAITENILSLQNAHAHLFKAREEDDCARGGKEELVTLVLTGKNNEHVHIPYYSNPDIEYSGVPTGIENDINNVERIRNFACAAANMRAPDHHLFAISITGPSEGCPNSSATFAPHVTSPLGPFEFQWSRSTDGFNYTNPVLTEFYTIGLPGENGSRVFIKLQVTALSSGETAEIIDYIEVNESQSPPCPVLLQSDTDGELQISTFPSQKKEKQIKGLDFKVIPNPIRQNATLNIDVFLNTQARLDIYTTEGRFIKTLENRFFEQGKHQINLDLEEMQNGVYILRFQTKDFLITEKITVLK